MTTRVLRCSWLSVVLCFGCGASAESPSGDDTSGGEACRSRTDADELAAELATCREGVLAEPDWPAQAAYDTAFELVRAHLQDVSPPREVTSEEVQPIADAIWALLDAVTFPPQPDTLRTRAEDATEALLRDRGREPSATAAQAAFEAVTAIRATLHPPVADPCAELETRAQDAETIATRVCPQ